MISENMPPLFKSSSFQTYMYYFVFPLLICISVYFLIGIISYGNFGVFNIIMIMILLYALVESTESLIALRKIEVREENIIVKTLFSEEIVEYRDIVYVYNLVTFKSAHLIIWYEDIKTNKLKVMFVFPERKFLSKETVSYLSSINPEDLAITKYIRERAIKDNSNYLKIHNPRYFLFSISPTFKI